MRKFQTFASVYQIAQIYLIILRANNKWYSYWLFKKSIKGIFEIFGWKHVKITLKTIF